MAEFNYESKIISGTSPDSVNAELITWINSMQGDIEIVSSNMLAYQSSAAENQWAFTIYTLFIRFPVS